MAEEYKSMEEETIEQQGASINMSMNSQEEHIVNTQQIQSTSENYPRMDGLGDSLGPQMHRQVHNTDQAFFSSQFPPMQFPIQNTFGLNHISPYPLTAHELYGSKFPYSSNSTTQIPYVDTQVSNASKKSKKHINLSSPSPQSKHTQPCTNYRFWSIEEDIALTKAYLYISVDSIIGKDQSSSKLWDRILKIWRDLIGTYNEKRGPNSLSCRWNTIQTAVCKFHSMYESLERVPRSGITIVDMKREALNMYRELGDGTPFKFEHCWEILKDNPKWCTAQLTKTCQSKKTKNSNIDVVNVSSPIRQKVNEMSSSVDADHLNVDNKSIEKMDEDNGPDRPLGRKGSKEKKRKLNEQKTIVEALNNFQSTLQQQNSLTEQNMKLRHQLLEKDMDLKEKAHQLKVETQAKKQKKEKRKEQERILNMDLHSLQPTIRAFYENMQREILKEWEEEGFFDKDVDEV